MSMRGKYVIAGIGHTPYGKLGLDTVTLNVMACRQALEDAGVDKADVDALLLKTPSSAKEILYGQKVAQAMGMGIFETEYVENRTRTGFRFRSLV